MLFRHLLRSCVISRQACFKYTKVLSIEPINQKNEEQLKNHLNCPSIHIDEDEILMNEHMLKDARFYYPLSEVDKKTIIPVLNNQLNFLVIQPWVSYIDFKSHTEPDLQLAECISLVNTVPNWKVVEHRVLFTSTINRKQVFKDSCFDELKQELTQKPHITALFLGIEVLSRVQVAELERQLKIPVYDRFTTVLNIFREFARTKEAKIQIALAELPYIRSNLREIHESSEHSSKIESLKTLVGGVGDKAYHQRLSILRKRETRLRQLLEMVKSQRDILRKNRRRNQIPTVSIVGYTNSGKTSLIKYLTGDENIVPLDRLFATLDVTVHEGFLKTNKSVLYVDTVGFISRIPYLLVEAFEASLKDVALSNLIIHVTDITHPDYKLQYRTVYEALTKLEVPTNLLKSRITVGNKFDLLDTKTPDEKIPNCDLLISAKTGSNCDILAKKIDKILSRNISSKIIGIRVENGGNEYQWLLKNCTIIEWVVDEKDANYLICEASFNPSSLGRWKKTFGLENVVHNIEAFETNKKEDD